MTQEEQMLEDHMKEEQRKIDTLKHFEIILKHFEIIDRANREGYAGVLSNGNIVDRREVPEAYPVAENPMFNVSAPRCIGCEKEASINKLTNSKCKECRRKAISLDAVMDKYYLLHGNPNKNK